MGVEGLAEFEDAFDGRAGRVGVGGGFSVAFPEEEADGTTFGPDVVWLVDRMVIDGAFGGAPGM